MLNSLTLSNYRGFRSMEIPRFAGVNLIGGVNNAGKTGLLESIYLLLERNQHELGQLPGIFRAPSQINNDRYFWQWIASEGGEDGLTTIEGNVDPIGNVSAFWESRNSRRQSRNPQNKEVQHLFSAEGRVLNSSVLSNKMGANWPTVESFSPRPTQPVEDAQVYIRATKRSAEAEERIEDLLREIDCRVKRVRAFPDESTNQPLLHIGLQSGPALPAPQFGQGFNRLLRIYSAILAAEACVFLIDEIETGLHHSVLPLFWKGLAALARLEGVQIFATTHSREAILTAHRVFIAEPTYDFAYHRLERSASGDIIALTYDQESLAGADEANFEVR